MFVKCIRADEDGVLKRFDDVLARMAERASGFTQEEVDRDVATALKAVRSAKKR
jgi:hypothetical protein